MNPDWNDAPVWAQHLVTDTDFIKAMQQGLPPITPPATPGLAVTEYRMDGVLLGNADIEINNHEAINGLCTEETNDDQ